jgi:hypothetical protein
VEEVSQSIEASGKQPWVDQSLFPLVLVLPQALKWQSRRCAKIFVVQNSRPTIVFEKKRIDELSIGMELVQGLVKLLGVYSDDKLTGLKKVVII